MARGRLQDEMLSLCKHVLLHRHARPWSRNMDFVGDGRYTMKLDHLARSSRPELLILRKRSSFATDCATRIGSRSEEHTSELQSLMRISYAVFCLQQKKTE